MKQEQKVNISRHPPDSRRPVGCRYIDGDPSADWRYCQRPRKAGSSYCPDHHARCHRPSGSNARGGGAAARALAAAERREVEAFLALLDARAEKRPVLALDAAWRRAVAAREAAEAALEAANSAEMQR